MNNNTLYKDKINKREYSSDNKILPWSFNGHYFVIQLLKITLTKDHPTQKSLTKNVCSCYRLTRSLVKNFRKLVNYEKSAKICEQFFYCSFLIIHFVHEDRRCSFNLPFQGDQNRLIAIPRVLPRANLN